MKGERIIWLDLLRIFSMMGIIWLHVINNWGIIGNLQITSHKHYIILALLVLLYTSVDIFWILTGYLNISKKKNNNSRIVELIFIIVFYCIAITTLFYGFNILNIRALWYKEFIANNVPILFWSYWYITSYVFIFFTFPYLNKFLNNLKESEYKKLLIIIFVFLSVIPNILCLVDLFHINNGYSPFRLIYMYMIWGYIKNHWNNLRINIKYFFWAFFLSFILNTLIRIFSFNLFGHIILSEWFINYISPFTIFLSICLLLFFKDLVINNNFLHKITILLSSASFSVYIIHCHKILFDYVLKSTFQPLTNMNFIFMTGGVIASILIIYLLCTAIDKIREMIFNKLKIRTFIKLTGNKLDRILN